MRIETNYDPIFIPLFYLKNDIEKSDHLFTIDLIRDYFKEIKKYCIFFFFLNIRSDGSLIWKAGKIDSLINYSKIFRGKFENSIYYMIDNMVSNISRIN